MRGHSGAVLEELQPLGGKLMMEQGKRGEEGTAETNLPSPATTQKGEVEE